MRGGMGKKAKTDYQAIALQVKAVMQTSGSAHLDGLMTQLVQAGDNGNACDFFEVLVAKADKDTLQALKDALPKSKNIDARVENCYGKLVPEFAMLCASIEFQLKQKREMEKAIK